MSDSTLVDNNTNQFLSLLQQEIQQGITKICPSCSEAVTKLDGCNYILCRCGCEW